MTTPLSREQIIANNKKGTTYRVNGKEVKHVKNGEGSARDRQKCLLFSALYGSTRNMGVVKQINKKGADGLFIDKRNRIYYP